MYGVQKKSIEVQEELVSFILWTWWLNYLIRVTRLENVFVLTRWVCF